MLPLLTTLMSTLCYAESELTVDLYNPKYAYNQDVQFKAMQYALPADPIALLSEVIDPKTHKPIRIHFVCNTHSGKGNGSFNNPFNTLKAAEEASQPFDIIYVFRGDGTSQGMEKGICLKDHQHLLGSSYPYTFETRYGTMYFPQMTKDAPVITHSLGNAVELGSHNEIHGLAIYNAQGWGIYGKDIQEAQIQNTSIHVAGHNGAVGLEDVLGHFEIVENQLYGAQAKHVNGIEIQNHGEAMANFTIRKNVITHFSEGIVLHTFDKAITLTNIAQNAIGACLEEEIDATAYDSSELHSFIIDNILTQRF